MLKDWKILLASIKLTSARFANIRFASFKHLAIAICISFLLHLLFIGSFHLSLPSFEDESHVIDARLVASPKVLPTESLTETVENMPVKAEKPIQPEPEPVVEAPQNLPQGVPTPEVEPVEPVAVVPNPTEQKELEPNILETEPEPDAINLNAYKYVETEFDVRTDINAKVESSPVGRAKIIYELLPSAERYRITSLIEAKGLAALLIPDLSQTSEGYLSDQGLRPITYLYKFGDKKDKTFSAKFDWEKEKLILTSAKGTKEVKLVNGAQDLLSFMYRFMFVAPLQNMELHITNGKKLGSYQYSFEGEEVIYSKAGDLRTIHLARVDDDNDDKTELWLALDYQYVPVKIRKTEKEDKVYELLVTSLKTTKPEEITEHPR